MGKQRTIISGSITKWDEDFLFEILDNISDAVMITDADTVIVYVNKAYEKILGASANKAIGRILRDMEPDAVAVKVIDTGVASHNIVDYLKTVDIHAVGLSFPLYREKKIIGAVSIFNDISEIERLKSDLRRTKEFNRYLQKELEEKTLSQSFDEYVYCDQKIHELLQIAAKVAKTNVTVIIRGESGVGKEVLARAIYKESNRNKMPFIKVNCASIPENLLESELFGYEDGAFTDARKGGKLGKFELAQGGTIFLDEIGDMSFNMQAKILRVLQEREIERVGGTKVIPLDVRVMAATNRNLEEMMEAGQFRSDLYFRLNVIPLVIPPLRERKDDVMLLAQTMLNKINGSSAEAVELSADVIRILYQYNWPGNVRELQNVMEHANIIRSGPQIEVKDLPQYIIPTDYQDEPQQSDTYDFRENINMMEKELIKKALIRNNNNKSKAIKELGLSRRAFYEKLSKYQI
ncbi:MAG: sigma-54 interaction domain-containing protein [Lachnospiraceae bacterium]